MRIPVLAAAVLSLVLVRPTSANDEPAKARAENPSPPAPAMKIHVDPATGQLVPRPVAAPRQGLSVAPVEGLPPLKVEKVTAKAGGKSIRLDDRFMMEMSASAGPEGTVGHDCAAGHEKAARAARAAGESRHDR